MGPVLPAWLHWDESPGEAVCPGSQVALMLGLLGGLKDGTQELPTGPVQVMSLEEAERILDETQEAVEYQRVGVPLSLGPTFHQQAGAGAVLVDAHGPHWRVTPAPAPWWPPLPT